MALAPEIDLVLLFVPSRLKNDSKLGYNSNPRDELSNLITTLSLGGLSVTARPAVDGSVPETNGRSTPNSTHAPEIYIFVSAPPSKLAELYNAQAHADFLLGVPAPSWRIREGGTASKDSEPNRFQLHMLPPADRIRLVYEYITSLRVEGGLGIVVDPSQSG